jgi:hypothetical protein
MIVEIKPSNSYLNCYNLYVNDHIALVNESMVVCSEVKYFLENALSNCYYSEGAEIADTINQYYKSI